MTVDERRWSALLFVLLGSIYILTTSGRQFSVDGMAMYQQSKTLLFQHTFRFSPPFVWYDYAAEFTYWPEGLSFVYIAPLAIWSYLVHPDSGMFRIVPNGDPALLFFDPSYAHVSVTNCLLTAFTAVVVFRIAIAFAFPRNTALAAALVYGLASPAFAYQKQDFAQPLAACLITLAILLCIRAGELREAGSRSRFWQLAAAGLCLGLLVMTRSETQLIVIPLFVIFLAVGLRHSSWRERTIAACAVLVPLVSMVVLHAVINNLKSGSPVGVQTSELLQNTDRQAILTAFAGLLISPGRGLFVFFPLALYAPAGLYRLSTDRRHATWAGLLGLLIVLHIVFFSFWPVWWGGVSWGPRFLVPVLPLLTLLAFWPPAQETVSPGRGMLRPLIKSGVVAFGFVIALTAVLLPWDAIEGRHGLPRGSALWTAAQKGAWFFRLDANPLWTNLGDLRHPRVYDLLVLQPNRLGVVVENFIVSASAIAFIVAAATLIRAVREK